jgi:hypothetical protein
MSKRRARPSSRKMRGKAITAGAIHPDGRQEPEVTRKCQLGRHSECEQCDCGCHGQDTDQVIRHDIARD